jgi:tetratricopeptide (TPR) repeat protein
MLLSCILKQLNIYKDQGDPMNNIQQKKQQANELRKQGRIKGALPLYKELYESAAKDKFDCAGYLHCLRKLKKYEEAVTIAEECEEKYPDFNWCRIEIIWTYIGNLKNKSDTTPLGSIIPIATKIMNLNPDDLQKNTIVLLVLKKAKEFKKFQIACEWVDKINPETLDKNPIVLEKGTTAWSNFLIWHHHKIRCLIHQNKYHEAIKMVNSINAETKQVSKYFRALEALAYELMGSSSESVQILTKLSKNRNVDWWVVHQLANVLKNNGEKEQALERMYEAAVLSYKIESIVTLLQDIALLCQELNRMEESYYHSLLCKLVRQKKEWAVREDVEKLIKETSTFINKDSMNINFKEVLQKCQTYWGKDIPDGNRLHHERKTNKKHKKALVGTLSQVRQDKPFCFIKTPRESFFCYKSEINVEVVDGLKVQFDVIPSFDKKKQQESLKAVNVVVI